MISPKQEFLRARREIHEEGLARTIFYRNKNAFKSSSNCEAYVILCGTHNTIILMKSRLSYKNLILTLGHEYGHVIDYLRWSGSARWRLHKTMPDQSDARARTNRRQKIAFLKTELFAERYVPVFLKKFNITVDYDFDLVRAQTFSTIVSIKYELMYGRSADGDLRQQWETLAKSSKLDPKWLYNFKKLLK